MSTTTTYTFESALALLKAADNKLWRLQARYASKTGRGEPGPVPYRYESMTSVEKILHELEMVVSTCEVLEKKLLPDNRTVSEEQNAKFCELAAKLGL